jgi:hypothetical protein
MYTFCIQMKFDVMYIRGSNSNENYNNALPKMTYG